jgi:hypothetical protein
VAHLNEFVGPEIESSAERIVARVDARFDHVYSLFDGVFARLDRIDTELLAVKAALRRVESRLDSLECRMTSVESELGAIRKHQPVVMGMHLHKVGVTDILRG